MKKGKAAGIGIAVIAAIAAAIVFGIASLPDEVLLETPLDASENIPVETFTTDFQSEIVSPEEQTVETEPEEEVEPETAPEEEVEPETEPEEETEGNVIEIKISDGVGGGDR